MTYDAGHPCCAEYGIMKRRIAELEAYKINADALMSEGAAKIPELMSERDAARQEAADLRAALREAQEPRTCDECGAIVSD